MKLWLCLFAAVMVGGCVAAGYSDGDVGVGYVGGFYDPCCYSYGGWGNGYRVGPPRGYARGPGGGGGHFAPSIPHGARGGFGGAHGGGHGGGGHH